MINYQKYFQKNNKQHKDHLLKNKNQNYKLKLKKKKIFINNNNIYHKHIQQNYFLVL